MLSSCLKGSLCRLVVPVVTKETRSLSSMMGGSGESGIRAFPQYTVYGENCMLSVKVMAPAFRILRNNLLVLDGSKKGRILLEWTPRTADGSIVRDNQLRFGLSPEEVGLMLHQLPQHQVEFVRRAPKSDEYGMTGSVSNDMPEKVLRITPGESGMVSYKIDFEKDGVSGQTPPNAEAALGPLEVVAQLGEHQVMMELMRYSIPVLTGWSMLLNAAMQRSVGEARGMGQGQGDYSGGGPGTGDLPF